MALLKRQRPGRPSAWDVLQKAPGPGLVMHIAGPPEEAQLERRHGHGDTAREAWRVPETKYRLSMGKLTGMG